jgi:hypothetical protein
VPSCRDCRAVARDGRGEWAGECGDRTEKDNKVNSHKSQNPKITEKFKKHFVYIQGMFYHTPRLPRPRASAPRHTTPQRATRNCILQRIQGGPDGSRHTKKDKRQALPASTSYPHPALSMSNGHIHTHPHHSTSTHLLPPPQTSIPARPLPYVRKRASPCNAHREALVRCTRRLARLARRSREQTARATERVAAGSS